MRYGLYCENSAARVNAKFMLLFTNTIMCLILLISADYFGRKKLMKVAASMVLIGIFVSAIIPQFSVKMFALGLVSGGEGTFSALFTIYINENTAKTTKLRSSLVSICFLAYAIGCIFVNTLAYFTTNPNVITLVTAGLLIVSVLPCFCGYIETPYFLWKRGRIGDLYDALMTIYKYNQDKYGMDPTLQLGVQPSLWSTSGYLHTSLKELSFNNMHFT